jgi:hypothetical protein
MIRENPDWRGLKQILLIWKEKILKTASIGYSFNEFIREGRRVKK